MARVLVDVANGIYQYQMIDIPEASNAQSKRETLGIMAYGSWTGDITFERSFDGERWVTIKDADKNDMVMDPNNPVLDIRLTKSYIRANLTGVSSTNLIIEVQ